MDYNILNGIIIIVMNRTVFQYLIEIN